MTGFGFVGTGITVNWEKGLIGGHKIAATVTDALWFVIYLN